MARFRQPDFGERLSAAATAKEVGLEKYHAKGGVNDPEVLRKQDERLARTQARETRLRERKLARAAQEAAERSSREAGEAAEKTEREQREARERTEEVSRKAALEEEKKAERDARYAARKVRKRERQNSPSGKLGRR
ncbi:hypothetical protein SAMN05444161_8310 [Rhizobiales bacterium GAS191]|jgi:hypothetical protein|nr:hypothetical protein SAMN05444161_8310 [Rhizobiales bacterium GAS191]